MNKRIKNKIQSKKDAPWATKLHKGKAWHSRLNRWVRLWPDPPEFWGLDEAKKNFWRMKRTLDRGAAYTKRTALMRGCGGNG